MEVIPLAFDSLGTRSMSTFVKTENLKILIDPGVSLAPSRFGLPPHPIELKTLEKHWQRIVEFGLKSDVLIVTHYHYDHHNPWEHLDIYEQKIVFLKHPEENINYSQKRRASFFLEQIRDLPKRLEYADGKSFKFKKTRIEFSPPVFHGTNPRLGYVIETLIDDGKHRLIHTSDVEGPSQDDQLDFILRNEPNLVILDGPLSYMMYRFGVQALKKSIHNMIRIIEETPVEYLIVDHHFLRDLKYKERLEPVIKIAKKNECRVITAAEFLGVKLNMLEAHRKDLYKEYPIRDEEACDKEFVHRTDA